MFERFTSGARAADVRAQDEARAQHALIGTEHLLLGLLAEQRGAAAGALNAAGLTLEDARRRVVAVLDDCLDPAALATLGIDLDQVRSAAEASFGPGALDPKAAGKQRTGHIPLTKRAKKVLELSLREAQHLGHNSIGTGHILLGMLRDGGGLGVKVLIDADVDIAALRDEVTRLIGPATP
jgi:ATP-dependent Clp protease ATP-binding subunit ClpA